MNEILIGGAGVIFSAISSGVTWILARRKYNSEVDGNLIQNMQKSLDFYQKLSDDNKERLEKALADNTHLRTAIEGLLEENKQLKKEIDSVKDQMLKLTTSICTDLSCQLRSKDFSTLNMTNNEEI